MVFIFLPVATLFQYSEETCPKQPFLKLSSQSPGRADQTAAQDQIEICNGYARCRYSAAGGMRVSNLIKQFSERIEKYSLESTS